MSWNWTSNLPRFASWWDSLAFRLTAGYALADGGFNAKAAAAGTYTFAFAAQNSQGTLSTGGTTPVACAIGGSTTGCAA